MRARRLASLVALSLACARVPSPPPDVVDDVRAAVARCPVALDDAALRDVEVHAACPLPAAVAALVRNDDADDAPGPADLSPLARRSGAVPREAFERALTRIVDPAGALGSWIAIDASRGVLLPDPVLAPGMAVAFAPGAPPPDACGQDGPGRLPPPLRPGDPYRPERRAALRAAARPGRPLAGLHVAVDPGHAGGALARLEAREVEATLEGGRAVVLREGDLTLRTALELRAKLAALGAEVSLTRDAPGLAPGEDLAAFRPFADALLRHLTMEPGYQRLARALAPADRLRLHAAIALFAVRKQYRFASLRGRAERAARAGADLLLSIHYNAAPRAMAPAEREELVAMIAGNAGAERLYNPSHRAQALRAALDPDALLASAHLGARCVARASALLGVATAAANRYPDHLPLVFCDGRTRGVDAWDGALLRYATMPAVLVEGPYVTEGAEAEQLAAALAAPLGAPGTRTERFAEALARCVTDFEEAWLRSERNPFGQEAPEPR